MMNEQKIRKYIRKILLETEQTRRPGRGGYKKQIQQAGSLAKSNPGELMNRLKISAVNGKDDIRKLNELFKQAVSNTPEMSAVYSEPQPRKDKTTGAQGIRIPIKVIPPRDARKYLEHTLVGAQNSRRALFIDDIQVEILGNDILLYFSSKPYSWGKAPKPQKSSSQSATAKPSSPQQTPPETQSESGSASSSKKEILGEPDLNPDRDEEDEDNKESNIDYDHDKDEVDIAQALSVLALVKAARG